jgi:hypothetical protein
MAVFLFFGNAGFCLLNIIALLWSDIPELNIFAAVVSFCGAWMMAPEAASR